MDGTSDAGTYAIFVKIILFAALVWYARKTQRDADAARKARDKPGAEPEA